MGSRPQAMSLFSGQGGLDIGIENAGYEVLCAIDINKYACETLRQNRQIANMSIDEFDLWFSKHMKERCFQRWRDHDRILLKHRLSKGVGQKAHFSNTKIIEQDIRNVDPYDLMDAYNIKCGEFDLIIGGPPCQTFSRSGKKQSLNDERGQLFLDFARFVKAIRPRWFVFENVKGIIMTKTNIPTMRCKACEMGVKAGFEEFLDWRETGLCPPCPSCGLRDLEMKEVVDVRGGAVDIIVNEFERLGYRCHTSVLNALNFGAPQSRERFFIVGNRDGEPYRFPDANYEEQTRQVDMFSKRPPRRSVWDALFSEFNPYHGPDIDIDRSVLWVKNLVRPHDEPVTWSLRRPAPTVGAHQSAKLAIAPFGVPVEQLARQQWHTLGRRQGDTPPVKVVHTYLSDEDLLKLQTFPIYWFVAGTRMERAFQIGNAVPPVLAEAVARNLDVSTVKRMQAAE